MSAWAVKYEAIKSDNNAKPISLYKHIKCRLEAERGKYINNQTVE